MNNIFNALLMSPFNLFVSKNMIMVIRDNKNNIVFANSTFCEITGQKAEYYKGMKFDDLFSQAVIRFSGRAPVETANEVLKRDEIFFIKQNEAKEWFQKEEFAAKFFAFKFTVFVGYNISKYIDNFRGYFTEKKIADIGADLTAVFLKEKEEREAVNKSIRLLGETHDVSRVYLFENQVFGGKVNTTQKYEWVAEGITPQLDNSNLKGFQFSEVVPFVCSTLLKGECINSLVKDLPKTEREIFESQQIVSVLLVPIIFEGIFWGFIGYDDCFNEKIWTSREIEALRITANSIGLFIKIKREEDSKELHKKQMEAAFKNSRQGIWTWNLLNDKIDFSEEIVSLLGYTKEEFGDNLDAWVSRIHPDEKSDVLFVLHKHAEGETDYYESEYRIQCKDGNFRWILDRGRIFERNELNQPISAIGTHADIQYLKEIKLKVEEDKKVFRALYDSNPMPMLVINRKSGAFISCNSAARRLYGYSSEEFLNVSPSELCSSFESFDFDQSGKEFDSIFQDGVAREAKRKDGTLFFINVLTHEIIFDAEDSVLLVTQDITEHLKSELALKESEAKYKGVVSSLKEGLLMRMADGSLSACNKSAENILGYSEEELLSNSEIRPLLGAIHLDGSPLKDDEFPTVAVHNSGVALENTVMGVKHPSGKLKWLSVNTTPLYKESETVPYATVISFFDISESVKRGKLLKESEDNFRNFFDNLVDFVFILDMRGNILTVNETTKIRLGYTEEELVGKHVLSVHPEDRREEAGRIVAQMLEGSNSYCPVPLITKSGQLISVETRVTLGRWSGQDVLFGTSKDISELRESEEKFHGIFENSPVLIALTSRDGVILDANDAFLKGLGFRREDALGKTTTELNIFYIPEQRTEILTLMEENGFVKNFEVNVLDKEGIVRTGLLCAEFISIQGKRVLLSTITDITELKRLNSENKEYRRRFEYFFNSLDEAVFILDIQKDEFVFLNPAASVTHEMPINVLEKGTELLLNTVHPDDLEILKSAMAEAYLGKKMTGEVRVVFSDGRIKWLFFRLWVAMDELGQPQYLEGISSNITEMKLSQQAVLEALEQEKEVSEMKTMFVATTSHEFRTPLAGILSSIEILESYSHNWSEDKKGAHYLKIKETIKHMIKMLNDMLILNRSGANGVAFEPEMIDVIKMCSNILAEVNPRCLERNVKILFTSQPEMPLIYLDKKLMIQIITNILTNAVKYSKADSKVLFDICEQESFLKIEITDFGLGMSEKTLSQIYEPFFRSPDVKNIQGTGLGLPIVKNAVDIHSGIITFNSKIKEGTKVVIKIPVTRKRVNNLAISGNESKLNKE